MAPARSSSPRGYIAPFPSFVWSLPRVSSPKPCRPYRPRWDECPIPDQRAQPHKLPMHSSSSGATTLLQPPQLRSALQKSDRAVRYALMRIAKARGVAEDAQHVAAGWLQHQLVMFCNNPVLDDVNRNGHNPRACSVDAVADLVCKMDLVTNECQSADGIMKKHVALLIQLETRLTACAIALQDHSRTFEARASSVGRGIAAAQTQRTLDSDPEQAAAQREMHRACRVVEEARVASQAAVVAAKERIDHCKSGKAQLVSANYARKTEHAPQATGCPARSLYDSWSADRTWALEWASVGTSKPAGARPLDSPKFASALRSGQCSFRRDDLIELGVLKDVRRDHYVKVGSSYFRPASAAAWEEAAAKQNSAMSCARASALMPHSDDDDETSPPKTKGDSQPVAVD